MREQLESLNREQSILLLTMLMHTGEESLELLRYLPEETAQSLAPAAQAIASLPRKEALPQVIREIQQLLKEAKRSPFELIDPAWMAEFLVEESPRSISALLQDFPRATAERVIMALPGFLRQQMPRNSLPIHDDIKRMIRQQFDAKAPKVSGQPQALQQLSLEALAQMPSDDLMLLIRELGTRELAIAFRSAGRGPLTNLCRILSPPDVERLLEVIRSIETTPGSPEAKQEMKSAQRVLQAISNPHRSKKMLIEDAGIAKLKEASLQLSAEQQSSLALSLPRELGKQFKGAGRGLPISPHDIHRILCETLQTISALSQAGKIAPQWGQLEIAFPPPPAEAE